MEINKDSGTRLVGEIIVYIPPVQVFNVKIRILNADFQDMLFSQSFLFYIHLALCQTKVNFSSLIYSLKMLFKQ